VKFSEVWFVDFEFESKPGNRPRPACLVALELYSRRKIRLWWDEFEDRPPYRIDSDSLIVAYWASAELNCHLAQEWRLPECVLDLGVEFRLLTNGIPLSTDKSLAGAAAFFGVSGVWPKDEKSAMQTMFAERGRSLVGEERRRGLDYCESDVVPLMETYLKMAPHIDFPRAIYLRGRSMAAMARIETEGVPIDTELHGRIVNSWEGIKERLVKKVDVWGIYDGIHFRHDRHKAAAEKFGWWGWAEHANGQLRTDRDTFGDMARIHPEIYPLHELRHALSELRLNDLSIGEDGRNRYMLKPFIARTGRNCPSNSEGIFGPSVWLRSIIRPPPGYGIAYIDWKAQEFGEAAKLSGDQNMIQAYRSGDAYLGFAKLAGAVPADATKATHGAIRELYKTCALGVNYGMGEKTLAFRINHLPIFARSLLEQHHALFPQYWRWSDLCVNHTLLYGWQESVFGWRRQVFHEIRAEEETRKSVVCSLRNFHLQANGAEMLRLACCLGTECGVRICAPIHDAVMIISPAEQLQEDIALMRACMAKASRVVLDGFELETESSAIFWPEHYSDPRGAKMFSTVMSLL
jgi:hypothetical protein